VVWLVVVGDRGGGGLPESPALHADVRTTKLMIEPTTLMPARLLQSRMVIGLRLRLTSGGSHRWRRRSCGP
jgi:hypothetical protein